MLSSFTVLLLTFVTTKCCHWLQYCYWLFTIVCSDRMLSSVTVLLLLIFVTTECCHRLQYYYWLFTIVCNNRRLLSVTVLLLLTVDCNNRMLLSVTVLLLTVYHCLQQQEAIQKKEQYLQDAKTDRKQLETSMRQVSDWLRGAEELLDSGIDGMDYSSVDQTLSEYTVSIYPLMHRSPHTQSSQFWLLCFLLFFSLASLP